MKLWSIIEIQLEDDLFYSLNMTGMTLQTTFRTFQAKFEAIGGNVTQVEELWLEMMHWGCVICPKKDLTIRENFKNGLATYN